MSNEFLDVIDNRCMVFDMLNIRNNDFNTSALIVIIASFLFFVLWYMYSCYAKRKHPLQPLFYIGILVSIFLLATIGIIVCKTNSTNSLYEKLIFMKLPHCNC